MNYPTLASECPYLENTVFSLILENNKVNCILDKLQPLKVRAVKWQKPIVDHKQTPDLFKINSVQTIYRYSLS